MNFPYRDRYPINHPQADEISIQDGDHHYCRRGISSELAFFKGGEWVVTPVDEFAEYHDGSEYPALTAVYSDVPNELVYEFLSKYSRGY